MNKTIVALMGGATLLAVASVPSLANAQTGGLYQQVGQSAVYFYQNGSLHHIPSATLFNDMGLSWNSVQHVSTLPYRVGQPVDLIQVEGSPRVYYLTPHGHTAEWIPSAQAFDAAGFSWANVQRVPWMPAKNVTNFTMNIETGWSIPGSRLTLDMLLPNGYVWMAESNPSRSIGEQWTATGHPNTKIVASVVSSSMTQLEQDQWPISSQVLWSGQTGGAYFRLTIGPARQHIRGTEIVSTGTTQYGWQNPLGHPGQDQSLLINVMLPNTPTNRNAIGAIFNSWGLVANNTGATFSGNQPMGHQWLPGWPLNPIHNSNARLLPNWVTQASWGAS